MIAIDNANHFQAKKLQKNKRDKPQPCLFFSERIQKSGSYIHYTLSNFLNDNDGNNVALSRESGV